MAEQMGKYGRILDEFSPAYGEAAREAQGRCPEALETGENGVVCRTGIYVAGPVLTSFVWWVLQKAKKQKLRRLYFLARDGHILLQIARLFCRKYALDMECRYLYCSRLAWRKAAYCLSEETGQDHIFEGGYHVTPRTILMRTGLKEEQIEQLLQLYAPGKLANRHLNERERAGLRQTLQSNPDFLQQLRDGSRKAYETCVGYLEQEGMADGEAFGIVDTGWTGSIQKSLHSILAGGGKAASIEGFYFGLVNPPTPDTGAYHAWYLCPDSPRSLIGRFNNILIECFCGNQDPMTIAYQKEGERFAPRFAAKNPVWDDWSLSLQQSAILLFTESLLPRLEYARFSPEGHRRMSRALLDRFLFRPDRAEAAAYGRYLFCDDSTEQRLTPLALELDRDSIKRYRLHNRLRASLLPEIGAEADKPLYWPYGSLAISEVPCKELYRFQFYIWNILHHTKRNIRGRRR